MLEENTGKFHVSNERQSCARRNRVSREKSYKKKKKLHFKEFLYCLFVFVHSSGENSMINEGRMGESNEMKAT